MSDQVFRIVLTMDGIQGPAQAFRQTASAMQQHAQAARQVQRQAAQPLPIRGPNFRIARAQADLARAQTPQQIEDAQFNLALAQMRLLRARRRGVSGGGIGAQIGEAIMSARIGIGPGGLSVMPVVARVFDIIRSASPVLGAWLVGITAVTAATIEAARSIRTMAAAAAQSGGTFGQATMLARLGVPAGQIAGAAAGLRERLSSDPYAMMAGARLGIGPQPPPQFGSQNFARTLIDALQALRQVRDAEEQLRLARMLGIESMIDLARVSGDVWQGIRMDAATAQLAITPETQQGARDLTTGLGRLGGNLMTLLETITAPMVKLLAPALNALATIVDAVTVAFTLLLAPVNAAIDGIIALAKWLDEHFGTHLSDNTDALRENTRVMREGYFGGGARARGAIPSGMGGEALKKALEGGALRYGAWQLGAG